MKVWPAVGRKAEAVGQLQGWARRKIGAETEEGLTSGRPGRGGDRPAPARCINDLQRGLTASFKAEAKH